MTPYDVLGVPPGASAEVVKAAHRALAAKLHPDRPGGDAQAMARVNTAYTTLNDPTARRLVDRLCSIVACPRCGGTGLVKRQAGFKAVTTRPCPECAR